MASRILRINVSVKAIKKELREDLHYWQMQSRLDARSLKGSREKCKEIAERMRFLSGGYMKTGMLWFDNDPKTSLVEKIERAVDYFKKKYEQVPNLCLVHPSMMPAQTLELATITVRPYRPVRPGHFWIGVEEKG